MRLLLDTNVLVSGVISRAGPPGQLVDAWLDKRFDLVTSAAQQEEFARVLTYPKIARRLKPELVRSLLENMRLAVLAIPAEGVDASPDLDDNIILATALAGDCQLIVSGDNRGMLDLGALEDIPILTARQAVDRLG